MSFHAYYDSNSNLRFSGSNNLLIGPSDNKYIEMRANKDDDNTLIDFHSKNTGTVCDYDSRILATGGDGTGDLGTGNLQFIAKAVSIVTPSLTAEIPLLGFFRVQWLNKSGSAIVVNNSGSSRGQWNSQTMWTGTVTSNVWTTSSSIPGVSFNTDVFPSTYTGLVVMSTNIYNIDTDESGEKQLHAGSFIYKDENYSAQSIGGAPFNARTTATNKWILSVIPPPDGSGGTDDVLFDVILMAVSGSANSDYGPNRINGRTATTLDFDPAPDVLITGFIPNDAPAPAF